MAIRLTHGSGLVMKEIQPTATTALARFTASATWDAFPDAVKRGALRALLNGVGTALASAQAPAVVALAQTLQCFSDHRHAALIGGGRMDAGGAAFVNAVASNMLDFDDTHLPTIIHPTAPVAFAALALAEWRRLSGLQLLEAFVAGGEVICRVGLGVSPGHYARGWHITSTCGVFGAAAACARLLRLDAERSGHALGIAASLSAGLVENLPTAGKNASVGNAARNGMLAALLAEAGQKAAPTAIEGPLGWARACGDTPDIEAMIGDLGARWELDRNTFKAYPAGIVMHAVIDACLGLRATHALDPADIASVTVTGDALLLARGDRVVATAGDARVSIHHCAAVALLYAKAGVHEFSEIAVFDAGVVAMRAKVTAVCDSALPVGAARVRIVRRDGSSVTTEVAEARGGLGQPLTDANLEAKFRELARTGSPSIDSARAIDAIWTLEKAANLDGLVAALSG
jgi:2-methylcitrate dehydratase PrpD